MDVITFKYTAAKSKHAFYVFLQRELGKQFVVCLGISSNKCKKDVVVPQ